ncbi:hypothetical protein [Methanobacterium sp.]|jgi:hypothetical protein|uniref:hypothetical protein n=1 Tax=Methanobacterium sp. TaxID=2164 RepID=UPI00315867A9
MKKELVVLLLIFIATVGLSSAASAQPVTQTARSPSTYGHGGHGTYYYGHWVVFRRFVVASPFAVNSIRHRYHSPMFRVTARYIGHHRWIATVWRRGYFRR